MNEFIENMKCIISKLNQASEAYYKYDNSIMSDKEYDDLYDKLLSLENTTGITMANSPTKKVQGYILDGLKKVKHSKPMLSANKTKDISDIQRFVGDNDFYASMKLDGLTTLLRYENGKFKQGITRGNGIIGEDVTEACKFISNIPLKIPYKEKLEIRGETVISWEEFNRINNIISEPYSHPRNLAAGTLRNLNMNVVKDRNLSFVVFECVSGIDRDNKYTTLNALDEMGFETVKRCKLSIENSVEYLKPENYKYPADGIIFEIESKSLSKSLGATNHHENCRIALKWTDQLYETTLTNILWQTSKSGLINPVAIFEPVDLDGAITTRATLHNISYIENLQLGIGDIIQVYRANMVIPKIHNNLTRSNTWQLPTKCPCCEGDVKIQDSGNSKALICANPNCGAKLINRFKHFCSRDAINIEGMSEVTLQKFINRGFLSSFKDIYYLKDKYSKLINIEGFGVKSIDKLLNSIEKSRKTTLGRFIYSLSIPLIGKNASNQIEKYFKEIDFLKKDDISNGISVLKDIQGFGEEMCKSIDNFLKSNIKEILSLAEEFEFITPNKTNVSFDAMENKIFVITGNVNYFKNRNELKEKIESMGGKVTSTVTNKTDYLINNDINSKSSKNQKAKMLNVPIITEEEFLNMIK